MGPISGISAGAAYPSDVLRPVTDQTIAGGPTEAGTLLLAAPAQGSTVQSIGRVFGEVSELLQSIGGGLENDRLLRTLVALMIILALLDRSGDATGTSASARGGMDAGGEGRTQYVGIFSSSTTISIQQTSTAVVMAGSPEAFDGGSLQDSAGTRLDMVG